MELDVNEIETNEAKELKLSADSGIPDCSNLSNSLGDDDYPMGSESESYCSSDFEMISDADIEAAISNKAT